MIISEIMKEIRKVAKSKGFKSKGRTKFPEKIALMHSELSEALEEFRDNRQLNEIYFDQPDYLAPNGKPEGIPIEFADVIIRILDTCEANGIDIEKAIRLKINYNKTRPYKHGKTC